MKYGIQNMQLSYHVLLAMMYLPCCSVGDAFHQFKFIQGLEILLLRWHVILQNWEEEKLWESSTELSAETYTVTL